MRRFHSYGPVDCERHFCVRRKELVEQCLDYIVGDLDKGGHYFTIWGPRQTGKTWLLRQVKSEIENRHSDRFLIGNMSMQGLIMDEHDPDEVFFGHAPTLFRDGLGKKITPPQNWDEWSALFAKGSSIMEKPVILFIDEFDSLPVRIIDTLVSIFRNIYLNRETYVLHGLALIGVHGVLGVDSERGSPFNIQRSLHVPNFTFEEVQGLFQQYQNESGQTVDSEVPVILFHATRGQPGLVCWFGELLTEKYNPGPGRIIDRTVWKRVYRRAGNVEWNNTVLNLIKKARGTYQPEVLELFARSDIPFALDSDWCSYLYLNGVIDSDAHVDERGEELDVCRFSSPFVQERLYSALTSELVADRTPILALEPLDELADVFDGPMLDVPALMNRYRDYLKRLKAKGLNPWKDQPRRMDLRLTEAVGHFHLYAWLREAVGRYCVVSPEFPTGNGKVDLHLRCDGKEGIIEVKSFRDSRQAKDSVKQAASYAAKMGLDAVTLAMFVPVDDETLLERLSGEETIEGVRVSVLAIEWM